MDLSFVYLMSVWYVFYFVSCESKRKKVRVVKKCKGRKGKMHLLGGQYVDFRQFREYFH